MMIPHHPLNVQIFDGHRVELPHDLERRLVMEIRPLPSYLPMPLLQQFDGLAPAAASLVRSATDSALSRFQPSFGLAQKFRVPDHFACRERGKVLDPHIHANPIAGLWKVSALILLNGENHIPAVSLSLNPTGLDRPFNRARKTDPARTDF
jgi:hypothetical protein